VNITTPFSDANLITLSISMTTTPMTMIQLEVQVLAVAVVVDLLNIYTILFLNIETKRN
jgi:hypothetical protein